MAAKNERGIFADLDDYFWHRFLYEEICDDDEFIYGITFLPRNFIILMIT